MRLGNVMKIRGDKTLDRIKGILTKNDSLLLPVEAKVLRLEISQRDIPSWKRKTAFRDSATYVSVLSRHGYDVLQYQTQGNDSFLIDCGVHLLRSKNEACASFSRQEKDLLVNAESFISTIQKLDKVFKRFGLYEFRDEKGSLKFTGVSSQKNDMVYAANYLLDNAQAIQQTPYLEISQLNWERNQKWSKSA